MSDTPNLFPGLTPEDRARLAAVAGNLETLPELIDRLNRFVLGLDKVRPVLPAVVDTFPISKWQRNPLAINEAVPLMVDDMGRLMVSLPHRRQESDSTLSIPAGGTVSAWLNVSGEGLEHGNVNALWDDKNRLAAEVITVQGAWKIDQPDPAAVSADAFTINANLLGATIGVVAAISSVLGAARWVRLSSAVAVGAGGRSFRITSTSQ